MKIHHAIAIAALAASGTTFAQSTPPPDGASPGTGSMSPEYTRLDSNKDGLISKKEAVANKTLTAKWSSLDANKDGKLDEAEFARFEIEADTAPKPTP